MKKRFQILFLIFGFSFLVVNAQTKPKLRLKKTVRGEAQLVRPFQNRAFANTFSGVFNTGVSMNWGWNKKYNAGIFYSLTQYQIFPAPFQGTIDDPHSIQTTHTIGLKYSHDKFTANGKGIWSYFIAPGYSFISYSRIKVSDHAPQELNVNAASLNVGIHYYMMFDEWMGVGFTVGYNAIDHVFHPYNICVENLKNYSDSDKRGSLQSIFFGFSFYFDFAYKPEVSEQ